MHTGRLLMWCVTSPSQLTVWNGIERRTAMKVLSEENATIKQQRFEAWPVQSTFQMCDWNGVTIEAAQSRGHVVAVADFSNNMLKPRSSIWPTAAVVQKLCCNKRHASAFDGTSQRLLSRKMGFYSDLQSLHSEDAITWSFFGTLSTAELGVRVAFLNWLLDRIEVSHSEEEECTIELWRRIPHPDTQGMGGPEIDFLLQGEKTVVLGEAKWLSGEGAGQGLSGDKTQLQLRKEFCEAIGRAIFGRVRFVVLSVVRAVPLAADSDPGAGVTMRTVTWEELARCAEHPQRDEFQLYYDWKQRWSTG